MPSTLMPSIDPLKSLDNFSSGDPDQPRVVLRKLSSQLRLRRVRISQRPPQRGLRPVIERCIEGVADSSWEGVGGGGLKCIIVRRW